MARAARYIVIDDQNIEVNSPAFALDFQVPFNCYRNVRSILTWMVRIWANDGTTSIAISINSIPCYFGQFAVNVYQPMQEVIDPNVLLWGKNTITFETNSTASSFVTTTYSDIVLLIEVDI